MDNQELKIPLILDPASLANLRNLLKKYAPPCVAAHGTVTVSAGATAQAVAHGLKDAFGQALTPNMVTVSGYPTINGGVVGGVYVSQNQVPDSINIYLQNDSPSNPVTAIWYAAYLT